LFELLNFLICSKQLLGLLSILNWQVFTITFVRLVKSLMIKWTHLIHKSNVLRFVRILWYRLFAIVINVLFKLLTSELLKIDYLLSFSMNSVICVKLLLKLNYLLVTLIESTSQCYHYITILHQNMFVSVNLLFIFFYLLAFSLNFS
jgi:hypothetical protein